jgi:hypothetical protein
MANNIDKQNLKKDFKAGKLNPNQLGTFIELAMEYRSYYFDKKNITHWAGPWRNDLNAASFDAMPFVQQGFKTGIRQRVH